MNLSDVTFEYAVVTPPAGLEQLACAFQKPADWVRVELPSEQPDLSDPTAFLPLSVTMAPWGAVLFTIAARPAFDDGTVLDWAKFLASKQPIVVEAARAVEINGQPALLLDATQPSEAGPMRCRVAFLEDGKRLYNLGTMAPAQAWAGVEAILDHMLASFRLAHGRGPTAALGIEAEQPAPDPAPTAAPVAPTAPPDGETESGIVTEDPRLAANAAPPAGADRPTRPVEVALAEDAASLDPGHPTNARLRDNGVGLVPRVLAVRERERYAVVAAGAVEAVFHVPLGWHVIDDGKRTLIFDAGGRMQINLNLRRARFEQAGELLDGILAELSASSPDLEHLCLELGGMPCLAVRNLLVDDERLHQNYLVKDVGREGLVLVCRVTSDEKDMPFAMNAAEVIVTSLRPPAPEPREEGPEWWARAQELERAGRFEEAEKVLADAIPHLGYYSQVAHLYELRAARLQQAGDLAGARDAARRASDALYAYAAGATSGGEGAALSLERDQRLAALRPLLS